MPGTAFINSIGGEVQKPEYYSRITRSKIRNELNITIKSDKLDIESYILGDISFSIENLKCVLTSSGILDIIDQWDSQIEGRKTREYIQRFIFMPAIIFDKSDIKVVRAYTIRPNYITNLQVKGALIDLDDTKPEDCNLISDKIVLLERADPGYDWIFSKGIKGLITKFGGAASHMAIRCAELDIPAALGCGEIIFNSLRKKKIVLLDCMDNNLTVIR